MTLTTEEQKGGEIGRNAKSFEDEHGSGKGCSGHDHTHGNGVGGCTEKASKEEDGAAQRPTTPSVAADEPVFLSLRDEVTGMKIRQASMNHGIVLPVFSYDRLKAAANSLTEAKGVIWNRTQPALLHEMEDWVRTQPEPRQCYAFQQIPLSDAVFQQEAQRLEPNTNQPGEGDAASAPAPMWQPYCDRLVAGLPPAFRETLATDASLICELLMPAARAAAANCMTLQIEIVEFNTCSRWHQDNYTGRGIITYTGPGTWMADDENVRFDQFEATMGMSVNESDVRIVPDFESVHVAPKYAISLMKGDGWPGIRGIGLTHKSPNVPVDDRGKPIVKRLILKIDVSAHQPSFFAG